MGCWLSTCPEETKLESAPEITNNIIIDGELNDSSSHVSLHKEALKASGITAGAILGTVLLILIILAYVRRKRISNNRKLYRDYRLPTLSPMETMPGTSGYPATHIKMPPMPTHIPMTSMTSMAGAAMPTMTSHIPMSMPTMTTTMPTMAASAAYPSAHMPASIITLPPSFKNAIEFQQ